MPAPASDPAVSLLSLFGPVEPEKSTTPPALVMNCALPPVLLFRNCVLALLSVVMVAFAAVLLSRNWVSEPVLVAIVAFAAVLPPANEIRLPPPLLMRLMLLADCPSSNVVEPLLVMLVMPDVSALTISKNELFCTSPTMVADE